MNHRMKRLSTLLAVIFLASNILCAQSIDRSLRAFNYLTGEETSIISIDLQKVREWGDVANLVKTPVVKKLCKDKFVGRFVKSLAKGDAKFAIDFGATVVIAQNDSCVWCIIPIADVSKVGFLAPNDRMFPTELGDAAHGKMRAVTNDYIGDQICYNDEVFIVQDRKYWTDEDWYENDVTIVDLELSKQFAKKVMHSLQFRDSLFAARPAFQEHLEKLTGIDIWQSFPIDEWANRFGMSIGYEIPRFCIWPSSSAHATIDEKGIHLVETFVGDEDAIADFISMDESIVQHVEEELVANIPAIAQSVLFSNMAGPTRTVDSGDTVQIEFIQRLWALVSRHPHIVAESGSHYFKIFRYDDQAEADSVFAVYQRDLQLIVNRMYNEIEDPKTKIEAECHRDTLEGAIHYLTKITEKFYYYSEDYYDVEESTTDSVLVSETDTIPYSSYGPFYVHWILKDGILFAVPYMRDYDSTFIHDLIQTSVDSPLKQRALAHINDGFYFIDNALLYRLVNSGLGVFFPTDYFGPLEGVARGKVYTLECAINSDGQNALAYLLKFVLQQIVK